MEIYPERMYGFFASTQSGTRTMNPMTGLLLGIAGILFVWRRRDRGDEEATAATRRPGAMTMPWPKTRDLSDNRSIRIRLPADRWFTVTDIARALQHAPSGRKPSGSAGRDARTLLDKWMRQGLIEVRRFGPSRRRFFRFA